MKRAALNIKGISANPSAPSSNVGKEEQLKALAFYLSNWDRIGGLVRERFRESNETFLIISLRDDSFLFSPFFFFFFLFLFPPRTSLVVVELEKFVRS